MIRTETSFGIHPNQIRAWRLGKAVLDQLVEVNGCANSLASLAGVKPHVGRRHRRRDHRNKFRLPLASNERKEQDKEVMFSKGC